jgi:hypothetical protein
MRFPLLTQCSILFSFLIVLGQVEAARIRVAILDGVPVYHWTAFTSVYPNDIDRALILREFHRQGYKLPEHFVDEAIQIQIGQKFGGDRGALIKALQRENETLAHFRQFTSEELILQAMRRRETQTGKNGRPPRAESEWLASLRKGSRIQMLERTSNQL